MPWSRWAALCGVLLLGLAGCHTPRAEVVPAPHFELPELWGGKVSLASLKGKVVVLDFWATWCGPCIREMPDYDDFWRRNRSRGVEVVGIVMESGDPQEIQDFVRENRIPYKQLLGTAEVSEAYQAEGLPTTFVIDGQGMIRSKMMGGSPTKFEILQETVDTLLSQ